jgi:hypothetical protein
LELHEIQNASMNYQTDFCRKKYLLKNLGSLLIILLFFFPAAGQDGYWQQQLHYTIDVTLDDREHALDGFVKLRYRNNSPDTLSFIWFHIWPNAYKNDRTAFSEQLLENGRTDFYFSSREQRGYINRLDFRVNNTTLRTEDDSNYIDIIKVLLAQPLPPGKEMEITTPFHVKLPYSFSRGGHVDQSYYITQWYPKPAVYDRFGWHPMPYLDQGEFYSEFGTYDVRITLPENYVVAATGELQNADEKKWLQQIGEPRAQTKSKKAFALPGSKQAKPEKNTGIVSSSKTKTIRYVQENVHDFAWFADKNFGVKYDTVKLASGRVIDAYSFYTNEEADLWKNSLKMVKDAIHFRSQLIGDYPYNVASIVQTKMGFEGGMEYPTITGITKLANERTLDLIIEHELGHNWFYAALANDERQYPWLDEGLNSYYDERYEEWKYGGSQWTKTRSSFIQRKLPENKEMLLINTLASQKKDQPINTPSTRFTELNYGAITYYKTAFALKQLENKIGRSRMDSCMRLYYEQWKFRHPQPGHFLDLLQACAGSDVAEFRLALEEHGKVIPERTAPKKIKPSFLFNLHETHKYSYINILPIVAAKKYDGFMAGVMIHNYNLPPDRLRFFAIPLYATNSKRLTGIGDVKYSWYPDGIFHRIDLSTGFAHFSTMDGIDSAGRKIFGDFTKFTPTLRFTFNNKTLRSTREKYLEWKTYLIGERDFTFVQKSTDSNFYPSKGNVKNRYLNQLTFTINDYRELYPYDIQLQLQQGEGFYRANATAHYFFNYANKGGANVRFFAAKFGYLGEKTIAKEFETTVFQPKLTAVRGYEDYTYSNYWIGRNENDEFASQQMMMRDGGLKIRTDLFQGLQGRSDNWIAALNLNTTFPGFSRSFPLRLFLDIGTYAEAWDDDAPTRRFLFVGGLQLSFFKEFVNIYAPVIYSSEFRDNLKTVPEENKFFRRLSFSIDVHRITFRRLVTKKIPL